jgi:hypothetical protein
MAMDLALVAVVSSGIGSSPLQGAGKADPEQGELMIFIRKRVKRERFE